MPRIKIDSNRIIDLSTKERNIKNKTNESQNAVRTVINNLDWNVSSKENINARLSRIQKRLQAQSDLMDSYIKVLGTVSDNFATKDSKLREDAKALIYQMNGISAIMALSIDNKAKILSTTDDKLKKAFSISALFGLDKDNNVGLKMLWDFAKEAGFVGGILGVGQGLAKFALGGNTGADITGLMKTGLSLTKTVSNMIKDANNIGKVARMVGSENAKVMWSNRMFGLTKVIKQPSKAVAWAKQVQTNFNSQMKERLGAFTGAKGGVKAGFAWAGVAIEGVLNTFKYDGKQKEAWGRGEEYSNWEKGTKIVTATIAGTVKTMVIGAAIAAIAPAAPVVIAAGAAAVIGTALDFGVSKLWDGKYDGVSDAAADAVWHIGKGVVKFVNDPVNTAKDVGKAIGKGFNNLVNCFNNPFGKVSAAWAGGGGR